MLTNRPYYPVEPYGSTDLADPRLEDAAFMGELAWVTKGSSPALASVVTATPRRTAIWDRSRASGRTDVRHRHRDVRRLHDSALGAYPEDNNGFDRGTAMPSTDPERMVPSEPRWTAAASPQTTCPTSRPWGRTSTRSPELPDCEPGDGIDADGDHVVPRLDVRYLVLKGDNPACRRRHAEGILWRIDVPHDNAPMVSGVTYGSAPAGVNQIVPAEGAPVELVPGQRYNLYALYDVALPIARCVFQVPMEGANTTEEGGCSTAGAAGRGTGAGFLALFWSRGPPAPLSALLRRGSVRRPPWCRRRRP